MDYVYVLCEPGIGTIGGVFARREDAERHLELLQSPDEDWYMQERRVHPPGSGPSQVRNAFGTADVTQDGEVLKAELDVGWSWVDDVMHWESQPIEVFCFESEGTYLLSVGGGPEDRVSPVLDQAIELLKSGEDPNGSYR